MRDVPRSTIEAGDYILNARCEAGIRIISGIVCVESSKTESTMVKIKKDLNKLCSKCNDRLFHLVRGSCGIIKGKRIK